MQIRAAVNMDKGELSRLWGLMVADGAAGVVFFDCEADFDFFREFIRRPGHDFNFVFDESGAPLAFF